MKKLEFLEAWTEAGLEPEGPAWEEFLHAWLRPEGSILPIPPGVRALAYYCTAFAPVDPEDPPAYEGCGDGSQTGHAEEFAASVSGGWKSEWIGGAEDCVYPDDTFPCDPGWGFDIPVV
jgi:hypothetical protein